MRDHPLMENSVTAAPLLVRKGITYTKLAVMQTGVGEERRGAVLHLGTGEGRRSRDNEQSRICEINIQKLLQMEVKNFLIKDKCVCVCVADRGELHRVAVVGQNATLLQEIPLFTSQEPVNNILLHQVEHLHNYSHILHTHRYMHTVMYSAYKNVFACVSRARLWWAALCLWLKSRLKAVLCITAVRCVPELEAWAVCGAQGKKPAGSQQQSEYYRNTTMKWKTSKNQRRRQTAALLG